MVDGRRSAGDMCNSEIIVPTGNSVMIVPPYETILEEARRRFQEYDSTVKRLRERVAELEDETYADRRMSEMRDELDASRRAMAQGFYLTDDERESISEWQRRHANEFHGAEGADMRIHSGAIGGAWTYSFLPTSIGVIGTVRCFCGEKFTFRDLL